MNGAWKMGLDYFWMMHSFPSIMASEAGVKDAARYLQRLDAFPSLALDHA